MIKNEFPYGLYDPLTEHSHCGVGFLTRKDGTQTHQMLLMGHEALCAVPHRGGMSSEGVGDGAGICVDLSNDFFSKICEQELEAGTYGVGNFFLPNNTEYHKKADAIINAALAMRSCLLYTSPSPRDA